MNVRSSARPASAARPSMTRTRSSLKAYPQLKSECDFCGRRLKRKANLDAQRKKHQVHGQTINLNFLCEAVARVTEPPHPRTRRNGPSTSSPLLAAAPSRPLSHLQRCLSIACTAATILSTTTTWLCHFGPRTSRRRKLLKQNSQRR